ncbi:MAG: cytochrome c1 [Rhodospirillaceae bacterium]|jgi:ubiquinol-cytochrome c reductase cytochrome c1 subunit|nr:cytochrome c1 [Rhodospirillaceae bacterium]MBT5243529.1 cytochrome c1 [Rhodospirillaceae bacterium]MBT5562117.1 cytochrome c1 [Rhodospirillaceae bacterium]MBT6242290.1 cytochrome c1 [Rhodospirillaceae bacterium]MBT7137698.1 cytochrome c1 [Rhodospirillaceae bacterium]
MMRINMTFPRTIGAACAGVLLATAISTAAQASGDSVKLEKQDWSFNGIFGTYDRGALKRGYQVYSEVCVSCHSLNYVAYRNLMDIGFEETNVKEIAAEFEVEDGPNDEGEMYLRPARPSDRFVAPYANEKASRAANNGAFPPDLSLMAKARKGGPDYLFGLLTRYHEEAPEGMELADGMSYNEVFPGHQIAMSQPLEDESVEYEDGTPATLVQHAKDVTTFLAWAASPEMEHRKRLGIKVMLFLFVWTGMLIALKKKIWAKLH